MSKLISTRKDIEGVIYLIDYIKEEHFKLKSKLQHQDYIDISLFVANTGGEVSVSTVKRVIKLKDSPTRISYKKLDPIVFWAFDGEFSNFYDFLENKEKDILNSNLISKEELLFIEEKLQDKRSVSLIKKIIIDQSALEYKKDEGFIQKMIDVINMPLGDFINTVNNTPLQQNMPQDNRVYQRLLHKESKRQGNVEKIGRMALEYSKTKKSINPKKYPSDDWIDDFFNLAQDTSDETMQTVWAKLLANEIDKPGSISRRTLSSIKLINAKEAEIFTKLCNCIWTMKEVKFGREKVLIKDMNKAEEYSDESWGFNGTFVSHLEEVGLVFDSFVEMDPKRTYNISFFGKNHQLQSKGKDLQLEIVVLSQVGVEIFEIINPKPNEEYYKVTMKYFEDIKILKK